MRAAADLRPRGTSVLFTQPTQILAGKELAHSADEHGLVLSELYLQRLGITTPEAERVPWWARW